MKTTVKFVLVLALALAVFGQHSSALAGGVFKFRGEGASAIFSSVDASGCVWTDVYVNADDGFVQRPPGPGSATSGLVLFISRYDACAGVQLLAAEGFTSLAGPDFQVSGKLNSAVLNTTVNAFDYVSGANFDVFVNLSWTGTGGIYRQSSHSHYDAPGCSFNSRFNGSFRPAVATGSVSDGATNFTPEPSLGYDIYSAKNGEVSIGCN